MFIDCNNTEKRIRRNNVQMKRKHL